MDPPLECSNFRVQFFYIASLPGLTGRQNSNNVPASCTSVCTILSGLQNSTDVNQLCTASNSDSLQRCANCILLIGGNTLFNNDSLMSQTQRAVNGEPHCIHLFYYLTGNKKLAFVSACDAASLPIPAIAISDPTTQTTTAPVTGTGSASNPNHSSYGYSLRRDQVQSGFPLLSSGLFAIILSLL